MSTRRGPRPRRLALRAALAALAALAAAGCGGRAPAGSAPAGPAAGPKPPQPSILLLSVDTLRADHLGSYGYERSTSPVIDRLAAQSVRFSDVFAPAPWTLPSHASMLSGVDPYLLGIRTKSGAIPAGAPLAAELFAAAGYQTAAFVDSARRGYVGAERGFDRGFAEFHHAPFEKGHRPRYDMTLTVDAAARWLAARDPARPFFLFLHTKSVHAAPAGEACLDDPRCFPYQPPPAFRFRFVPDAEMRFVWSSPARGKGQDYLWSVNREVLAGTLRPADFPGSAVAELTGLYDAGIAAMDAELGRLLAELGRLGLADSTIVVVTADHGEELLDHHLLMHQEVYQELLHVPLIVRLPEGRTGRVAETPATLADLAPTLLALARLPVPPAMTGRPLLAPDGAPLPLPARDRFAYYLFPPKFTYRAFTLRRGDWKLVEHNLAAPDRMSSELYDLAADPGERRPLASQPAVLATLRQALAALVRRPPAFPPREIDEGKADEENLKSLGYIN